MTTFLTFPLFLEVLKHITKYLKPKVRLALENTNLIVKELLSVEKEVWLFEEVFPFVLQHINRTDALKSRIVCKSWKIGIDRCLDNFGLPLKQAFITKSSKYITTKESLWNSHVYLRNAVSIDIFCRSMNTCCNPFVGSSLRLDINESVSQNDLYYLMVNRLLDMYGHYVLHFSVAFSNLFDDSYVHFLSWLIQLPNIQSLRITGSCPGITSRTKITKVFVLLHLPKLMSLEILDIAFNNLSQDFITALVQKYHTNLKMVGLPLDNMIYFPELEFNNISELVLYNVVSCIRLLKVIKLQFRNHLKLVQKITIYFDIRINMNDAFEILNEFKIPIVELRAEYLCNLGLYTSYHFQNNKTLNFLTSLTISDSVDLSYNFLNLTTVLVRLCILPVLLEDVELVSTKNSINERLICPLDAVILRCLYANGYPTKILWITLPKLEIFSVVKKIARQYKLRHFGRIICEKLPAKFLLKPNYCTSN